MYSTAVTRIGDQNFEVMSCQHINFIKRFNDTSKKKFIKSLIKPLFYRGYDASFIKNTALKVGRFLLDILACPCGISHVDLKSDHDREYKVIFHKLDEVLFAFVVRSLSDSDMRAIEQNTESKTYFTGDPSDMFKTKKDMH